MPASGRDGVRLGVGEQADGHDSHARLLALAPALRGARRRQSLLFVARRPARADHARSHDRAADGGPGRLAPEDAEGSRWSHVLWNCIGGGSHDLNPDVYKATLQVGDALLLCSDGLSKVVTAEAIREVLARPGSAEAACHELVRMANAKGGPDNITVVVAHFRDPKAAEQAAASTLPSRTERRRRRFRRSSRARSRKGPGWHALRYSEGRGNGATRPTPCSRQFKSSFCEDAGDLFRHLGRDPPGAKVNAGRCRSQTSPRRTTHYLRGRPVTGPTLGNSNLLPGACCHGHNRQIGYIGDFTRRCCPAPLNFGWRSLTGAKGGLRKVAAQTGDTKYVS